MYGFYNDVAQAQRVPFGRLLPIPCSCEEALEDLRTAIECRVFDKQGGIYGGTSNEEFQNDYFHDLETDCEMHCNSIFTPPEFSG